MVFPVVVYGCESWTVKKAVDGYEFEYTTRAGHGLGGLVFCDSWGRKELDMTELNWTEILLHVIYLTDSLLVDIASKFQVDFSLNWKFCDL